MNNMNLFEKYDSLHRDWCNVTSQISNLVIKWIEEHIGFASEAGNPDNVGKTNKDEISWSLIGNDQVSISYATYKTRWLDYWSDDKYVIVTYDELLKYIEE